MTLRNYLLGRRETLTNSVKGRETNPVRLHGYNVNDIKNWSAESDPFAKYNRSRVPLAKRIPFFAPTQVNPKLSPLPQVMNLSADYDKSAISFKYGKSFAKNLLKFWQYTDIYGAWHGLPILDSEEENPQYGVINLPNPAYTDAAHRNGVLSLGKWFWPREGQNFSEWVEEKEDHTFPVADKLLEMSEYFGFDGYFINQEATITQEDSESLMKMMKYMQKKASKPFHVQWYDAILKDGKLNYQNEFNEKNDRWVRDGAERVSNSIFLNYAWNDKRLMYSNSHAEKIGLDPYTEVFAGTENDKYGYNPPYDTRLIFPENGEPRTGWALFGTDFVWNRYDNKLDPEDQEEVYRRERRYWCGPTESPLDPIGRTLYKPYKDEYKAVNPEEFRCWDGVSRYIPERSVIGSYPFLTSFNTGHGKRFFVNGKLASAEEWNNASIQDILPTWQWWVTNSRSDHSISVSYDYQTAYDGGSSLKISGDLTEDQAAEIRLFKTCLPVDDDVSLSFTYKSNLKDHSKDFKFGLIFEDQPYQFYWVDSEEKMTSDWTSNSLSLANFKRRVIAAIGIQVANGQRDYCLNLGQIHLAKGEKTDKPKEPKGFTIDHLKMSEGTADVFLSWDFDAENVLFYEIYHVTGERNRELVGRIYDEVYYIHQLKNRDHERKTYLELLAVSPDHSRSTALCKDITWSVN